MSQNTLMTKLFKIILSDRIKMFTFRINETINQSIYRRKLVLLIKH